MNKNETNPPVTRSQTAELYRENKALKLSYENQVLRNALVQEQNAAPNVNAKVLAVEVSILKRALELAICDQEQPVDQDVKKCVMHYMDLAIQQERAKTTAAYGLDENARAAVHTRSNTSQDKPLGRSKSRTRARQK